MTNPQALQVWSPGRVNLIGEHTDYNDGWVLPCAIERGTRITARPRQDTQLRSTAKRIDQAQDVIDLASLEHGRDSHWRGYVRGSAWALQAQGIAITGAELEIDGDLPLGGGLSSSASLEVGVILALLALNQRSLSATEVALLAQKAEREYVGVNCGIMDQLAVAAGVAQHALLIDCRSLHIEPAPIPAGVSIIIVDSGVPRTLADSAYNQRRAECEAAVAALHTLDPTIKALRDVNSAQLQQAADSGLLSGVVLQRARHVISENERTLAAVSALRSGDLSRVGQLMNASHASLRDDYAVSSPALDTLSELLRTQPGVFGARLTGAGFGGCCIALAAESAVEAVSAYIGPAYHAATGNTCSVIVTQAAAGAHVLQEDV